MKPMTPDEQRIAIAKACGKAWTLADDGWWDGPNGNEGVSYERMLDRLPDYLNDLNAMHGAEKTLTPAQHTEFRNELWSACGQNWRHTYSSTAAQRAEAFLRTIGKWEDDK